MIVTVYYRIADEGVLEIDEQFDNVVSIKEIGNDLLSVVSIDFIKNNRKMNKCITMDGNIQICVE